MFNLKSIIIATLFFLSSSAVLSAQKLIFAIDLIRHGDRTPLHEIPASPYIWKDGLGELTSQGVQQEFRLGQHFRRRYIDQYHLLPDHCQPAYFYVRTTDRRRTARSAEALLLELYPQDKRTFCPKIL